VSRPIWAVTVVSLTTCRVAPHGEFPFVRTQLSLASPFPSGVLKTSYGCGKTTDAASYIKNICSGITEILLRPGENSRSRFLSIKKKLSP
jgi:hypothetical protein